MALKYAGQICLKLKQTQEKILVPVLLFAAFVTYPGLAQSLGGGYSESYLLRNVGARSISMAGAYTAVVNEPSAIFYNPAGLSFFSSKPMFSTMYSFLEYGRSHMALCWGQSVMENFGAGIGINTFSSGSFMGRDARGNPLGTMTDWSYAIVGAASYNIDFASFGVSAKYLANSLAGSNTSASGFSFDLGTKFNVMDLFSFGIAIQDVSGRMFWNTPNEDKEALPFTIRTGMAMEFGLNEETYSTRSNLTGETETYVLPASRYFLVSLDAMITQYEKAPKIIIGAEIVPHEIIAFRAGLCLYGEKLGEPMIFPMNLWGAGLSLRPPIDNLPFDLQLDYSVSADKISQSGISHHISFVFEF